MMTISKPKGFARIKVLVVVLAGLILLTAIALVLRGPKSDGLYGMRRASSGEAGKAMQVHVNDREGGTRFTRVTQNAQEIDSRNLKETVVVATLDCPLSEHKNAIWCSTFQMAWDKFKTDVIKEPIEIFGAEDLARRLNRLVFPATDIEPQSYYANAGFAKNGILEHIRKDMGQRFPSEPMPVFDDRYRQLPGVAVAYAYLNVDIGFEYPYYVSGYPFTFTASDGQQSEVKSFDTSPRVPDANVKNVREQVEILFHEDGDAPDTAVFAVDLCVHTKPYQVILARIPPCGNLGEAAKMVQEKVATFQQDPDYEVLRKLRPIDTLVVPDVLYKLTHHFEELLGKKLGNERWRDYFLFETMQKIDFTLSRTGVVLKSEARMGTTSSRSPEELAKPRHLHFDRPFLICVKKREPGARPFFLMWVDNAELMKAHP